MIDTIPKVIPSLLLFAVIAGCSPASDDGTSSMHGRNQDIAVIGSDTSRSLSRFEPEIKNLDLGKVFQFQKFPIRFPFKIEGEDPVTLTELRPSCGCTEVAIEVNGKSWELDKPIPGGSTGAITGIFDSKNYSNRKDSSITIQGNATNLPMKLGLGAFVTPVFSLVPHQARFVDILAGPIRRNPTPTRKLEVTGAQPWELVSFKNKPEWITITDMGDKKPAPDGIGEIHTFLVELDPALEEGRYSGNVTVETNIGHDLNFSAYAELLGKVRYFPDRLVGFNLVERGDEPIRKMKIRPSVDWLEIPEPEITYEGDDVFEVILDVVVEGKDYVLTVSLKPSAGIGRHAGKVFVTWPEDSAIPNREYPITVLVREPR
ncbi:MAG: DUF1573 domain-containing protein [Planctomycetota bacterium]|jgi:hypothetical protein|nr:DUF1573 domain-containing protein [Planctomycetota bacterium]